MSRLHPFDVAFGSVADEWFDPIAAASADQAVDLVHFAKLDQVELILSLLHPGEPTSETVQAGDEYLRLLYAGYRFWKEGRRTLPVPRERAERELLHLGNATPASPQALGASYYQFPERWFWAQLERDAPHEPLDGLFAVGSGGRPEWLIVAVLGLRAERGGFSQISSIAVAGDFATSAAALGDPAFPPAMEGGTLAGFRSITSVAELLMATRLALVSTAP